MHLHDVYGRYVRIPIDVAGKIIGMQAFSQEALAEKRWAGEAGEKELDRHLQRGRQTISPVASMKTIPFALLSVVGLFVIPLVQAGSVALHSGDRLMKMSDRMVVVRNGNAIPLTSEVTLSDGTRLKPDGAVFSKNGSHRTLRDCEILSPDGKRIDDNTARIVIIDGQVMIMKGGVTRRLEMAASLGSGRTVTQDGVLVDRGGAKLELKEGQIVDLGGRVSGSGFEPAKRNIGSVH